ncbi:heterokaryon incompatibility protein-domain-containing protein [Coniochaeta sp. 2T2.1]|nr:heterokaryon incompatibility protein-domain-containing protein [Coniochaeta sp. 2T2.1]
MDLEKIDICMFCSDLVIVPMEESNLPSQRPHHPTYGLLSASSRTCTLCRLIKSMWPHFASELQRRGVAHETIENCQDGFMVKITVTAARRMQSGTSWKSVDAGLVTGLTPLIFNYPFTLVACSSGDPASNTDFWARPSTTFEEKVTCIQSWMQKCRSQDEHGNCRPVPFSPLRLVTVGIDGKPLRLVERDDLTAKTEYATLSYCWGDSLPLCTTTQSLDGFLEAIPVDLMPKTFTDAIHIVRRLGIPHIWIDALCIVQDDKVEWQSEAAQMSKTYRGSQLTITATQSASSSHGCFQNIKDDPSDGDLIFRTRTSTSTGRISLVHAYKGDIRTRATFDSLISTRGWTLQEQLLSSRVVFCMDPDIHWQCQACYQTQSGISFESNETLTRGVLFIPNHDHQLDKESHQRLWRRIASNYSGRKFTYPRDRVPAFAGISQTFASMLDNTYILGLCSKSFATDLGWLGGNSRPQMSSISGLPTWTWLSCQGRIAYMMDYTPYGTPPMKTVEHLQLVSLVLQWHGIPYVSQVKLAEAQVKGHVREILLTSFAEGSLYNPPYLQVFGENLTHTSTAKIPWRCAGQFDAYDASIAGTYLCLLLFSATRGENNDDLGKVVETFLIIEPVELHNSTRYRRLGSARIWGESPTFDSAETRSLTLV